MVVAGKYVRHAGLVKQFQIPLASRRRDIEVLIRLAGALQKPRMVLKDHEMADAWARLRQFRVEPGFLAIGFGLRFGGGGDQARVQNVTEKIAGAEAVI